MPHFSKLKKIIVFEIILVSLAAVIVCQENAIRKEAVETLKEDTIKWVDFNVSYEALCEAYEWDVQTYQMPKHLNWIELLAYVGAKQGGEFSKKSVKEIAKLATDLTEKNKDLDDLTKEMKYYSYYLDSYTAVLGGLVGEYEVAHTAEDGSEEWEKKYGLKGFSPIAKGFEYNDFDDFGSDRSYGYKRPHLGHDMMGQIGTPIIAAESGYVEAIGWNQYGGWRLGIRSFDKKRYYYYAHMRQNYPYHKSLEKGSVVTAGDVIGYMGHTGYSVEENVNNIEIVHLHFGMQLIFEEEQKESENEIWVDCYNLTRFLKKNRSEAVKDIVTKEWNRSTKIKDPLAETYRKAKENSNNT